MSMRKPLAVGLLLLGLAIGQDENYADRIMRQIFNKHNLKTVPCGSLFPDEDLSDFAVLVCYKPRPVLDVYEAGEILDMRQGYAGLQNDPAFALFGNVGWTVLDEDEGYKFVVDRERDYFVGITYLKGVLIVMVDAAGDSSQ